MMPSGQPGSRAENAREGAAAILRIIRAEWTKFRSVRGWRIGTVLAALVMVGLSVFGAAGSSAETCTPTKCTVGGPTYSTGPNGEPVTDIYYFVHRTLQGDGSLTVRVSSLTGRTPFIPGARGNHQVGGFSAHPDGWAKAGVLIASSTRQGAPYAAVMVTGGHGVRLQDNYVNDAAGPAASVSSTHPQWLRLSRTGGTITGFESSDGRSWRRVGSVSVALTATAYIGLFVTSPLFQQISQHFGGSHGSEGPTLATARFQDAAFTGKASSRWVATQVGANSDAYPWLGGSDKAAGDGFVITGSGDIAPATGVTDSTEIGLTGSFAGILVLVVLATLFITVEYRRGLMLTTLAATPSRGRVLGAKAAVMGLVAFAVGGIAAAVALPIFDHVWKSHGNTIYSIGTATWLRVVVGTALLMALVAALSLSIGSMFRRSATAVTSAIVLIVLPYILSRAAVLPVGVAQWILRLTPAAAFSIQQTVPQYSQVVGYYTPAQGYFPLAPWAGIGVLCIYVAAALFAAWRLMLRRDA
jgi:hypothetical protein